nr:hypothetical protein [Candidatus Woesearchaeota archaeon]
KNDPRSIVKMPDMSNTNNMTVDNSKTNSILKELLSVMKEKSMGTNVYSNQGTTSLEAVRMLGVAQ